MAQLNSAPFHLEALYEKNMCEITEDAWPVIIGNLTEVIVVESNGES